MLSIWFSKLVKQQWQDWIFAVSSFLQFLESFCFPFRNGTEWNDTKRNEKCTLDWALPIAPADCTGILLLLSNKTSIFWSHWESIREMKKNTTNFQTIRHVHNKIICRFHNKRDFPSIRKIKIFGIVEKFEWNRFESLVVNRDQLFV